jgi:hypothetical protein
LAPNVVGALLSSAPGLLPAPFALGTTSYVYSDTVERGRILAQAPQAGEMVTPGAVAVVVSGGTGLELSLARDYTSADLPIAVTAHALAPDGAAQALPALSYSVSALATPYPGSLPVMNGGEITFGNATRGAYRLSATGGGRTAYADFAVGPPTAPGEDESPMVEFVELTQTLQEISDLLSQAQGKDPATARALLAQAVTRWRNLDRDALRLTSPMTLETGFLPKVRDLKAAGVTPGPWDALNKQFLRESVAPLKALTEGLRAPKTPLTQLAALTAAFDAKARRVSGIMPSKYGAVDAASQYAQILGRALPEMIDAVMDDVGEGLGMGRETPDFPGLRSTAGGVNTALFAPSAAAVRIPLRTRNPTSSLIEIGTTLAIDQALEQITPMIDAAKKYAKDILAQAAWGAAVVALAQEMREYLDGQELIAVGSGASMSIHVFESPWAFIEANGLEDEYTDLNTVVLLGPDLVTAAADVVSAIKDAWKSPVGYKSAAAAKKDLKKLKKKLKSLKDSTQKLADTIEKSFQSTDEDAEDCLFSSGEDCTQLLFSDGFDSVYHYSGPSGGSGLGGLPVPILFIVRNNVSGQLAIGTPVFLPTAEE